MACALNVPPLSVHASSRVRVRSSFLPQIPPLPAPAPMPRAHLSPSSRASHAGPLSLRLAVRENL
eukprot:5358976-Pleurochrysis_carterae.AAC.1